MELALVYGALNHSIADVARATNVLTVVENEKPLPIIRLEEVCVVSDNIKKASQVITAHDLQQYKNKFYSVKLREETSCWLDLLLDIDREEEYVT